MRAFQYSFFFKKYRNNPPLRSRVYKNASNPYFKLFDFLLSIKSENNCTWFFILENNLPRYLYKLNSSLDKFFIYMHPETQFYRTEWYLFINTNFGPKSLPIFRKLTFAGKFFKLAYNSHLRLLSFSFGHSHLVQNYMWTPVFFLKKTLLLFTSKSLRSFKSLLLSLVNIRRYSLFTLRGLRFRRQCLFKKTGKVNTTV